MTDKLDIPRILYLYDDGAMGVKFDQLKNFIKKNFGRIKIKLAKAAMVKTKGLTFDFVATKNSFDSSEHSKAEGSCHIVITDKLFATLDENKAPHIRSSIYGFPSIISTSGIVEGPAKPKEYYSYKERYSRLGVWEFKEPEVKEKFKGRFIDYGDKRILEALKGCLAQALFYYMTGEPFCGDKNCRLYNAHWQEELVHSQVESGRFCARHKRILQNIRRSR